MVDQLRELTVSAYIQPCGDGVADIPGADCGEPNCYFTFNELGTLIGVRLAKTSPYLSHPTTQPENVSQESGNGDMAAPEQRQEPCIDKARREGKPYPRTCMTCGLGPCRFTSSTAQEAPKNCERCGLPESYSVHKMNGGHAFLPAQEAPQAAELPLPDECIVHILPSDLGRMRKNEMTATVASVAFSTEDERSVPLIPLSDAQNAVRTAIASAGAGMPNATVSECEADYLKSNAFAQIPAQHTEGAIIGFRHGVAMMINMRRVSSGAADKLDAQMLDWLSKRDVTFETADGPEFVSYVPEAGHDGSRLRDLVAIHMGNDAARQIQGGGK